MKSWIEDVRKFQAQFGTAMPTEPQTAPSAELIRLRASLMLEEMFETMLGMYSGNLPPESAKPIVKASVANVLAAWTTGPQHFNLEHVADGLADLIYVCVGAALVFGIPLDRIWDEVQRANMDKLGGPVREDGKILKPEGWRPPDIHGVLFGRAA